MIQDVFELINDYKQEFEQLEEFIDFLTQKYCPVADVTFTRLEHCINFMNLLKEPLGNGFICFENRCPQCNTFSTELWSYTEMDGLTVGMLLEFCIFLKLEGKLCVHEKVTSICVNDILICCILNEPGGTLSNVETQPTPGLH